MEQNSRKGGYPYSKKRVYLSALMVLLSLLLVALLFQSSPDRMLYFIPYFVLSTCVLTVVTFVLKRRFYPLLVEDSSEAEESKTYQVSWKMLLLVFLLLVAPLTIPLLLASVLGGAGWFILMISFISGVNISEIIYYLKAR